MIQGCIGYLSCQPNYHVRVTTQGGAVVMADLDQYVIAGSFTRNIDQTSVASVECKLYGADGTNCCDALVNVVGGWSCCELEIWRDGMLAWAGPMTVPQWSYGKITFQAEDLSAWWRRRIIRNDIRAVNEDLSVIFEQVHAEAMRYEAVFGFTVVAPLTGVLGTRTILGIDDKYASEVIDELSRTGIDWTVIGRSVLVGAGNVPAAPIVLLRDEDFTTGGEGGDAEDEGGGGPIVDWAGDLYASRVVLRGANNLRAVAEVPDDEKVCGLVERVFNEESIEDQASLDAAAAARLETTKNPWRILNTEGTVLKCGSPVEFKELIPGARVRIATNVACRPIVADFRLAGITADLTDNGVALQLAPIGSGGYVVDGGTQS